MVYAVVVYADNSQLYVLDHHNIDIDYSHEVIAFQYHIMILGVVLSRFLSKWGLLSNWALTLVVELRPLNHMFQNLLI